jgi:DNA-binding CsgD family transcriptional regulator/PAS domain-containing protein
MPSHSAFDLTVADLYKAGAGDHPWGVALERMRGLFQAQVVNLYSFSKASQSIAFSFEVGEARPEAALDFIRSYHRIDPRAAQAMTLPVGEVYSCHRHFDEAFVAQDRFYQEFLIPYGGRYSSGLKAFEDPHQVVVCGVHRPLGMQHLDEADEQLLHRLGKHLHEAVRLYLRQQARTQPAAIGIELLKRLPQPMLLVDDTRRIVFCNPLAQALLDDGHLLRNQHGLLAARHQPNEAQLLIALRQLALSERSHLHGPAPAESVFMCLQQGGGPRLGLYFYALRPESSMGAFGQQSLALVLLHDPSQQTELDPFVVAATWGLTPAEAKVAVALGKGQSGTEIAQAHGVSHNTVRSQIQSAMGKMGVARQAELVSLLATLPPTLAGRP